MCASSPRSPPRSKRPRPPPRPRLASPLGASRVCATSQTEKPGAARAASLARPMSTRARKAPAWCHLADGRRLGRTRARRRPLPPGARCRTASSKASAISSPIAPPQPPSGPTSYACGPPPWPMRLRRIGLNGALVEKVTCGPLRLKLLTRPPPWSKPRCAASRSPWPRPFPGGANGPSPTPGCHRPPERPAPPANSTAAPPIAQPLSEPMTHEQTFCTPNAATASSTTIRGEGNPG
jgi:hypothetical protein